MSEHIDFETQTSTTTAEGRIRPDVVVHLTSSAVVAIDAKTPLAAYEASLDATNEADAATLRRKFASDLRTHVKDLKKRDYDHRVAGSLLVRCLLCPERPTHCHGPQGRPRSLA
jgi:DNA recombination protein RmuC